MANIDSLKESITEMSHDRAISVILDRRESRREEMKRSKSKRGGRRKRSRKKENKARKLISDASDMSKEEAAKLLEL